jgi:PAS domain S-box-containing protein
MPEIVWTATRRGRIDWFNRRWYEYTGAVRRDAGMAELGRRWTDAIHPDDRARALQLWQDAIGHASPMNTELRLRREDGMHRWFKMTAAPAFDRKGAVQRWIGVCTDVDEHRRLGQHFAFIAQAGEVLAESLDLQTTLNQLLALIVPEFGDWAAVDLFDEGDRLKTVAAIHADPRKAPLVAQLCNRYNHAPEFERQLVMALRTHGPRIMHEISPDLLQRAAAPDLLRAIQKLHPRSTITIPLRTRGRTLGSLVAYWAERPRRYEEDDLPLFQELAKRAAISIENAQLYEHEHEVAKEFQRAALPISLPQISGIRFDGIYVPASHRAQVGGDWYDALQLTDGRVVISIGDVAGTGLSSAVIMSSMRQIIRGVAQVYADPIAMLDAADRTLKAEYRDTFVTAFVGVFDPVTRVLTYAVAGHPPPFVRAANGETVALQGGGLPLGLRIRGDTPSHIVEIAKDALLVFYTDGLVEAERDIIAGQKRLSTAIARTRISVHPNPARALYDAMLHNGAEDDVVILTMRLDSPTEGSSSMALSSHTRRWIFDSSDAETASTARHAFVVALQEGGAQGEELYAAELVFGELLGNVVRYAPGPIEITFDWSGDAPVLHVLDRGSGFTLVPRLPTDLLSERGRGLFIVWSLSEDFNVTKRFDGGSHARAVLAVRRSIKTAKTLVDRAML